MHINVEKAVTQSQTKFVFRLEAISIACVKALFFHHLWWEINMGVAKLLGLASV